MSVISFNRDSASQLSNEFNAKAQEIKGLVDKLQTSLTSANDYWTGDSYDSCVAKFDTIKPEMDRFHQLCEEFAQTMDAVADIFEQGDSEMASMVRYSG